MNAPYQLLDIETHDTVVKVGLNRPDKRNAINDAMIAELGRFFETPPDGARVVVLHGMGEHFCAGLDLHELLATRTPDPIKATRRSRTWHRVFDLIQFGELPVVSVLKGGVIGGGLELASATHVRVAESSTFFQLPEGQRGIFLGGGGSVRVPRIIGTGRVTEMMLTGRRYDAQRGLELGLVHELVADGQGLDQAMVLAQAIAGNAPASNYAVINGIPRIGEMGTAEGLFAETLVTSLTRGAGQSAERIQAFFEGRRQARGE